MQSDTRLSSPLRKQSSFSNAASHQCLWDIAAAWLAVIFSRHNRFAETHSYLQLTDRLLAADNNCQLSTMCFPRHSLTILTFWWFVAVFIKCQHMFSSWKEWVKLALSSRTFPFYLSTTGKRILGFLLDYLFSLIVDLRVFQTSIQSVPFIHAFFHLCIFYDGRQRPPLFH